MEDVAVVCKPGGGIVESPSEAAGEVLVDELDGDFADDQTGGGDLHPELHGEGVACFGQVEGGEGGDAVALETAERVGERRFEAEKPWLTSSVRVTLMARRSAGGVVASSIEAM